MPDQAIRDPASDRRVPDATTRVRAEELHATAALAVARNTDKLFARLLVAEWVAGVVVALLSPYTWEGTQSQRHIHVWAAIFLGGLITLFPAVLAVARPGWLLTRYVVACGQMLFGALLIHLTGGRIETHFHIFGSLAFLAFYWDWTVLIPASLVVMVDHVVRGLYFPKSIFGVLSASPWRIVEHGWWVVFEDVFLVYSCLQCQKLLATVALQRAELEEASRRMKSLERQRTAMAERKFKDIFETMEDGYLEAVPGGATTVVNPAAVRLFGFREAAELQAVPAGELLADDVNFETLMAILERPDQPRTRQARVRLKDGSIRIFEGDARLVTRIDAPSQTVAVMFRDVTDRLRADEEAQARLSADAANRLKSEYLAHMSHEIRTPMHAVLGLTNLALQTELTDRQRDYLTKVQDSGRNLLCIVNDILDFSKVEAGKLDLEQVHFQLNEVLDGLASTMAGKVAERGLKLLVSVGSDIPNDLLGDPTRLGQVLLNLVSNAVKFTEQGEIRVSVDRDDVARDEAILLRFQVQDTGVGIAAEVLPILFTPFSQADSSITRKFGGTGLGLAICRRLVHLMQGELAVSSELGRGSTFTFTALFGTAAAPEETVVDLTGSLRSAPGATKIQSPRRPPVAIEDLQATMSAVRGARILVVEDNPINQQIARELLGNAGIVVDLASNGQEGVERLLAFESASACPWDLVLMDLQMPIMDGYSATRAIRRNERFASLPILAMTAHVLAEERNRCFEVGMNDCVFKPIDKDALFTAIRRWIQLEKVESVGGEPPPAFPEIIGVDVARGLQRVAGNSQLYRTLLLDLARQHETTLADLRACLEGRDTERLRGLAHSLRGAVGNLGLPSVAEKAAELEALARQGPLSKRAEGLSLTLNTLDELLRTVSGQILSLLSPAAEVMPSTVPRVTNSGDRVTLSTLAEQLQASDGAALKTLPQALSVLGGVGTPAQLDQLARLVEAFEFDQALIELRHLADSIATDSDS